MYLYETHLHTYPVSRCAGATVREVLEFYKEIGFAGVFITNHFLDGNINVDASLPYEKRMRFYLSDYEEACRLADEIGISVFFGVEHSYKGTDFLVYGLTPEWYLSHPEIEDMKKSDLLRFLMSEGALVIQAHPFREASYIDHIRLFPRCVQGVEIINACRSDLENGMAKQYAEHYDLIPFAGSDNHRPATRPILAGMQTDTPVESVADFIARVKNREATPFQMENPLFGKQ